MTSYAAVLRAVRNAKPGQGVQLRQSDLERLALAVGSDGHDVEAKIRALLGCTAVEAKRVHLELVKRRLLRPVAMLAVGTAIVWGPAAAASGDRPTLGEFQPVESTIAEVETGTGPQMTGGAPLPGIPAEAVATITTVTPTTVATTSATLPAADFPDPVLPTIDVPPAVAPVEADAPAVPGAASDDSSDPAETRSTDAPDVGIPAGETPTVIIGG